MTLHATPATRIVVLGVLPLSIMAVSVAVVTVLRTGPSTALWALQRDCL